MDETELAERLQSIQSLADSRQLGEAERAADALVGASPLCVRGHAKRAYVLQLSGRLQEAVNAISEALRLSPGEPAYLFNRARWRLEIGDALGAAADCTVGIATEKAVGSSYYTEALHLVRAAARIEMRDLNGAGDDCDQVRDGVQIWFDRGLQTKESLLKRLVRARGPGRR